MKNKTITNFTDKNIECLRQIEKEHQLGERSVGGIAIIADWVTRGYITMRLYLETSEKIYYTVF